MILNQETFKCDRRCGRCCIDTLVILSNQDISLLKKLGYNEDFFIEYEVFGPEKGMSILKKRHNKWCVFLNKTNGKFSCSIYKNRPEICRKYPFFDVPIDSCLPNSILVNIRK